jgi:hypothetical protein
VLLLLLLLQLPAAQFAKRALERLGLIAALLLLLAPEASQPLLLLILLLGLDVSS